MTDTQSVIVFDNGSGYLKAGLSDVETPEITMLCFKEKLEDI